MIHTCTRVRLLLLVAMLAVCASGCAGGSPSATPTSALPPSADVAATSTPYITGPIGPLSTATSSQVSATRCMATVATREFAASFATPPAQATISFASDIDPPTGIRYTGTISFALAAIALYTYTYAITISNTSPVALPVATSDFLIVGVRSSTTAMVGVELYLGRGFGSGSWSVAPGTTERREIYEATTSGFVTPRELTWRIAKSLGTVTVPYYAPPALPQPTSTPTPTGLLC